MKLIYCLHCFLQVPKHIPLYFPNDCPRQSIQKVDSTPQFVLVFYSTCKETSVLLAQQIIVWTRKVQSSQQP